VRVRAAIARCVMEVAPEEGEEAAGSSGERTRGWSGGPRTAGTPRWRATELPPDEVLAADQRITAWAMELKKAGLEGDMDVLRARAFLDLLLGKDSRPRQDSAAAPDASPAGGAAPGGFAGRVTLTVPLTNLTRTGRPAGESSPGSGRSTRGWPATWPPLPARNPTTTWCVTVTDEHGARRRARLCPARTQEPQETSRTSIRDGPGFSFTATAEPGTWRLRTPGSGPDLLVKFEPHRYRAMRSTGSRPKAMIPGPSFGT
jgi:hypothetical protein